MGAIRAQHIHQALHRVVGVGRDLAVLVRRGCHKSGVRVVGGAGGELGRRGSPDGGIGKSVVRGDGIVPLFLLAAVQVCLDEVAERIVVGMLGNGAGGCDRVGVGGYRGGIPPRRVGAAVTGVVVL